MTRFTVCYHPERRPTGGTEGSNSDSSLRAKRGNPIQRPVIASEARQSYTKTHIFVLPAPAFCLLLLPIGPKVTHASQVRDEHQIARTSCYNLGSLLKTPRQTRTS
jgi:hypothetical protein